MGLYTIIFAAFILTALVAAAVKLLERKKIKQALSELRDRSILGICSSANFFGQESLGTGQIRGNGILVLTKEELYFKLWLPDKIFRIPLKTVNAVETANTHLKRTKFKPLLKVTFINQNGEKDSSAWLIPNVQRWKEGLEKLIAENDTTKTTNTAL